MSNPNTPPSPLPQRRPTAKRMTIRLAKERLSEVRRADLGAMQPAELVFLVDQLACTAEGLLALIEDGYPGQ